ncbi:CBN-PQN-85 protein [Caenorhabditis brenneri]|uniref:Nipped-B protein n=1 Tax=Caenorhabditis brenneri TaxID=135651 RepID=G0N4S1_CAEBE|nr:CBN-PQN-85 protein [Caenorhabditis brenneri]
MNPNNSQNAMNGGGNPGHLNFNGVPANAGTFNHQMAQAGATSAAGQYNPMLLQQQYLNFNFPNMNYANNPIFEFQQQQYLMQQQQQQQQQQLHHQHQQNAAQINQHQQQSQHHGMMFSQQQQMIQQMLQHPQPPSQQVPRSQPAVQPIPHHIALSNNQFHQQQSSQHQTTASSSSTKFDTSTNSHQQKLFAEQCLRIEKERKEQEERQRKQQMEEQRKKAEEEKKQKQLEDKRAAEELRKQRDQQERERIEEMRRREEEIRLEELRRVNEERERIEQQKLQKFAEERCKQEAEAQKLRSGMEERFQQVVAQPLTFVGTHFLPNFLDMIPFPYESMTESSLPHVFDMQREGAILNSCDQRMIGAISNALNNTNVDDIITRMDKLRPDDKETNDLFLDQLPPIIKALVHHNTSALDVDSHNDMELLENEDVMMTEDITRTTVHEPISSGYHHIHQNSMAAPNSIPSTSAVQGSMSNQSEEVSSMICESIAPISIEKRRQMMSVGKAPKAGGTTQRKKRDMVENLYDCLTDNFVPTDTGRRGRRRGRSEDDEELQRDLKLIAAMEEGETLPSSVTGPRTTEDDVQRFFETRKKRRKEEKVRKDRSPTPDDVIESRDAEWQERLRLKMERELSRKVEDEQHNAWSLQALAENETFVRFSHAVDVVLEQCESLDADSIITKKRRSGASKQGKDDSSESEEEQDEIDPDFRIELTALEDMRRDSTLIRRNNAMQAIGADRLMKLIAILDRNIRDAISADNTRLLVPCDDEVDIGDVLEKEICEERVKRASDACVVALNIMSSHRMHKQVILEDVIDRCIALTRLLLIHLIYPASDSVYKMANSRKKDRVQEETRRRKKIGVSTRDGFTDYIYKRMTEAIGLLATLAKSDCMTDTSIHNISSIALTPFFVANIGSLQISAMLLSANVFSRADDTLRFSMITDLLSSLHRAPQYTQKNDNNGYTLPDGSWISTTTALFIQLVQSTIKVPKHKRHADEEDAAKRAKKDEAVVKEAFQQASKVTNAFLNGFLAKFSQKGNKLDGEEDYRILFSSFLQELILTLYSPEWPAAEMILTALGSLLVKNFRDKTRDLTIRQASLEYLGNITAKLRRDMNDAVAGEKRLDAVVKKSLFLMGDHDHEHYDSMDVSVLKQNEKLKILESSLIDYLVNSNPSDIIVYACSFYVGEWYKETVEDMENARMKRKASLDADAGVKEVQKAEKKYERMMAKGADMKKFLSTLLDKKEIKKRREKSGSVTLPDSDAVWAVKFLAQNREFTHSFDTYLKHIVFGAGSETTVALRSKALKCLSSIIEADYSVLVLDDVQNAVQNRMVDSHAQVRESAVELIGRFVLYDEDYVRKYYIQIAERILDTGVAVRKRVIRIMREICEKFPTFEKIPDMLARMIRRVSDEEGVKKLVFETFTTLWFQPVDTRVNENAVAAKVTTMCSVAQHCIKDSMSDYLETLILHIIKNASDTSGIPVAVKQIVDSLVDHILLLEARKPHENPSEHELIRLKQQEEKYMAYLSTLAVFSKIRPNLLTIHVEVLLPYLTFTTSKTNAELHVTKEMIGMLERVIPLVPFPNNKMLDLIDDNLSKVIKYNGMNLVVSAVSCVAAIYCKFHRGATQTMEMFDRFLLFMENNQKFYKTNPNFFKQQRSNAMLFRAIFSVGVLCRYFPVEKLIKGGKTPSDEQEVTALKDKVFDLLNFFSKIEEDKIRLKALNAFGHFCAQHSTYLTRRELTCTYLHILNPTSSTPDLHQRIIVLQNLEMFLQCEEQKLAASHEKWDEHKETENLKEMELSGSGLGSAVIQKYWKAVLESYVDADVNLRKAAVQVVWLTLNQGLVTPGASIPTLIAMVTDPVEIIRNRIDGLLKEIDSKYSGMVQSKAMLGVRLAYKLHYKLRQTSFVRGYRFCDFHPVSTLPDALPDKTNDGMAVLSGLYQSLRTNRQQRRSFLQSVVKLFSEEFNQDKPQLMEYIFIADNLAMFPYQMIDEPLFVIRQIDQNIAQTGSALLVQYKYHLRVQENEDEDLVFAEQNLMSRLTTLNQAPIFHQLFLASQVPSLLLYIRGFLMQLYGFNETKVAEYLPSEAAKVYEKAVTRRNIAIFKPLSALEAISLPYESGSFQHFTFLATKIAKFRTMLLSLDQVDTTELGGQVTTGNTEGDYDDDDDMGANEDPIEAPLMDQMEH